MSIDTFLQCKHFPIFNVSSSFPIEATSVQHLSLAVQWLLLKHESTTQATPKPSPPIPIPIPKESRSCGQRRSRSGSFHRAEQSHLMRFLFNKFFYDWLSVCLSPRSPLFQLLLEKGAVGGSQAPNVSPRSILLVPNPCLCC